MATPAAPTLPPALPLAWWSAQDGFAAALVPMTFVQGAFVQGALVQAASVPATLVQATLAPAALDAGVQDGRPVPSASDAVAGAMPPAQRVVLIGVAGEADRERARDAIRQAVRAALVSLCRVDASAIALPAEPGDAPYALIGDTRSDGAAGSAVGSAAGSAPRRIPLAISHDEALSVAAIGLDGPVGIDVMRILDIADWQALARDYLGPDTAGALAALPPGERPAALARAWSEREARLKCLGRPLAEWCADELADLQRCHCLALDLADGYVGCLAIARVPAGQATAGQAPAPAPAPAPAR